MQNRDKKNTLEKLLGNVNWDHIYNVLKLIFEGTTEKFHNDKSSQCLHN